MKYFCLLVICSIFIAGCSQEKSVEELEEEYSIELQVQDIGERDPERIAQFDQAQVEGLLNHMNAFSQSEHGLSSDYEIDLHTNGDENQIYRIHLLDLVDEIEGSQYDLTRSMTFELLHNDSQFEPKEISSGFNGGGGVEWVTNVDPIVDLSENQAKIEIMGEWEGTFLYNGDLVTFNEPNTWYLMLRSSDLPKYEAP